MPRAARVRLADVAGRAGVSLTTASYILNGRSAQMRISADTEERVRRAARELRYRPNWSARTLRRSTTQTIGLISDFVASGAFASRLISGASAAARACDHLLVIGESLGDPETERLLVEEMLERQVDGIVYATLAASRVRLSDRLRRERVVLLNCLDPTHDAAAVLPDDVAGGRLAAETLLAAGLAGPVHVVGEETDPERTAGPDRVAGLAEALAHAGVALGAVVPTSWDVVPAREAVDRWLRGGARPSALVCLNDRIAMGTFHALGLHGLRVPADVSVVSFDGSELADWVRPPVTSVELPFAEMGARAVEVLMGAVPGAGGVDRLPLRLRPGASVRSPSSAAGKAHA